MKSRKEKTYAEEIEEITPAVLSEEVEVEEEVVAEAPKGIMFKAKENINVRTEPSISSTVAGKVTANQSFEVTEVVGSWGKLADGTGWVCVDYAKEEK